MNREEFLFEVIDIVQRCVISAKGISKDDIYEYLKSLKLDQLELYLLLAFFESIKREDYRNAAILKREISQYFGECAE